MNSYYSRGAFVDSGHRDRLSPETRHSSEPRWTFIDAARVPVRFLTRNALACLGVATLTLFLSTPYAVAQRERPPTPVAVSLVVQQEVRAAQAFIGTILPLRTSTVGSAVEERVVDFPVREGDRVRQGDVLARLRTRTLELQLASAQAQLEVYRQELAELENGTRPEEIEQGRARLARAKALRDIAQIRSRRTIRLRQEGSASAEELDDALAEAEQAEQAYQEARYALELLVKGPRIEQIARARAQAQIQEEEVLRLEDLVENHTIRAPFDGYIVAEHTEIGQWVAKGAPIIDMVELDTVEISVPVLEDYIRFVIPGDEARVEVGALRGESFIGEIASVVPQADPRSRSFPVKVRVVNETREESEDVLMKAGMFARVALPVGQEQVALMVPKDALVLGGATPVVYVVESDSDEASLGAVRPVPVQVGVADDGLIQVIGPLSEGQRVVVQGNERLQPNQRVVVIQSLDGSRQRSRTPATPPVDELPQ